MRDFNELLSRVQSGRKKTVALVAAEDEHALQALIAARDLVGSVLVGDAEKIRAAL